jgi:hypothetical protein
MRDDDLWPRRATGSVDAVLRLRHGVRLCRELIAYAVINRTWWVLPLIVALGAVTLLIAVGQAVAPYTLYTLF